jgi:hypothetical protein
MKPNTDPKDDRDSVVEEKSCDFCPVKRTCTCPGDVNCERKR